MIEGTVTQKLVHKQLDRLVLLTAPPNAWTLKIQTALAKRADVNHEPETPNHEPLCGKRSPTCREKTVAGSGAATNNGTSNHMIKQRGASEMYIGCGPHVTCARATLSAASSHRNAMAAIRFLQVTVRLSGF